MKRLLAIIGAVGAVPRASPLEVMTTAQSRACPYRHATFIDTFGAVGG